ncbi:adenosylcobalamin-dependent ribonucleoside-diphosphate reductase [Streptomyces sp. NPDC048297]|uniref:adenosylcobalamin-dependent ribonucleoside-diphosphate reductase n=1 Tax=Streptomyces sp. NPDC048297 TaxID=3365531 RepID=UPI003723A3EC
MARRIDGSASLRESTEEVIERVARSLAANEESFRPGSGKVWHTRFRSLMEQNLFWPSGRILNNAGTRQGQLASCFVLPLEDDFRAVFNTLADAANCHRTGGGTGFDLTPLRERGSVISSAEGGGASGPVSWLRLFDAETRVVSQGGKMRGANLASLSVYHPDVLEFIDAKRTVGQLHTFNLSVSVDDAFMQALLLDGSVELVSPLDSRTVRRVAARDIWSRICENAWRTGDPGVLFPDAINRSNPLLRQLGPIRTTNPCGEQTLYPYEASNLGSLNLASFLEPNGRGIKWAALEETTAVAVRLLDDAIDISRYPDTRITELTRANRRIGLGVMGYADLLIGLGIPYDSDEALGLIAQLGATIRRVARTASRELAKERGAYPNWRTVDGSAPLRNCAITTIAPTGTISMIAQCSSSIEPRFAAVWNKDVILDEGVVFADQELLADLQRYRGISRRQALDLLRRVGLSSLGIPADVLAKYRYAHDISGEWHVRTAARWQEYVDNAVSKTVNLPKTCTPDDVSDSLVTAWRLGCKGVSVYRQGSRERDLLSVDHVGEPEPARQSKQLSVVP